VRNKLLDAQDKLLVKINEANKAQKKNRKNRAKNNSKFNMAEFMFVSYRLASHFSELPESKILLQMPPEHLPVVCTRQLLALF